MTPHRAYRAAGHAFGQRRSGPGTLRPPAVRAPFAPPYTGVLSEVRALTVRLGR